MRMRRRRRRRRRSEIAKQLRMKTKIIGVLGGYIIVRHESVFSSRYDATVLT